MYIRALFLQDFLLKLHPGSDNSGHSIPLPDLTRYPYLINNVFRSSCSTRWWVPTRIVRNSSFLTHKVHPAPNGYLGGAHLPSFVNATKSGDFTKLVLVTSKESDVTKQAVADVPGKVEVFAVDYSNKAALRSAFDGVDVIVNSLGGHGAQAPVEQNLIEAGTYAELTTFERC